MVISVPVTIGLAGLIKHDGQMKEKAFEMMSAAAVNFGITTALKYSINRERPFITYPDIVKKSKAASPSFPSGHTSAAFAAATSVSLSYRKWYIIIPSYTWAGTVEYSRMHLGVHYPSDVLVGAIIGTGSAWLTYAINKKFSIKSNKKPPMIYGYKYVRQHWNF